jgi:hypothetical protein
MSSSGSSSRSSGSLAGEGEGASGKLLEEIADQQVPYFIASLHLRTMTFVPDSRGGGPA